MIVEENQVVAARKFRAWLADPNDKEFETYGTGTGTPRRMAPGSPFQAEGI